MRQHANACRVTGEVEALLRSGYPDGALARWRSLHEIAVTSILIQRHGKDAAEDFIRCGLVEAVKGMETFQETAVAMGREPYSGTELDAARKVRDQLTSSKQGLEQRIRLGPAPRRRHQVRQAPAESCGTGEMGVRLQVGKPERSRNLPGTGSTPRDERSCRGWAIGRAIGFGICGARPLLGNRSRPNDIRLPDMLHRG